MATSSSSLFKLAREIGTAVSQKKGGGWYGPHMAAATRAIADRMPLVDIILEVRDARIPFSSEFDQLRNHHPFSSSRRILVLNKMDLASPTQFKEWITFFDQQNCPSFGVNSHNKDNVKEFLKFLQAHVRNLRKSDYDASSDTVTVMLLGIPNVGKSALANSLHQIGRITAAGILPPEIHDVEVCSKLALTGAIGDSFVGGKELAQYFLGILNFSDEYKKWAKFSINQINKPLTLHHKADQSSGSESGMIWKRQNPTDHTQDFMVQKVRKSLYEIMSCFNGNLDHEKDLVKLIEAEFKALREAFQIPMDSGEDADSKVASKLLNLYRTGRLGHYTLDHLPKRRASCE
ncbi:DAR GTPase 2 [Citrus sinensis]|uniref:DAR GTPase 2 n=1 Tax=Citrus sinensis TaxID=2711 RepID=A0ACB8MU43_CITSI|nr:DAR GTPase 2 [Citrus sinensis]KAH9789225.1 DAR GTPase 2 [Citrus sinensis]